MHYREEINRYRPKNETERQVKRKVKEAIRQSGDRILLRDNTEIHMTASGFIMNSSLDKVLMVYHNIYQSVSWTGGHCDGEDDLLAVAVREAKEETGIKECYPITSSMLSLDILPVREHKKKDNLIPEHEHISAAFGLIASERQALRIKEDENSDVRWMTIEELREECREPHMLPLYETLIQRMRQVKKDKEKRLKQMVPALLQWYEHSHRDLQWRRDKEPYHIWISEIMLQQTRVEAVKGYYERFMKKLPNIETLANVSDEELLKLWEGLGYYNRARNLKKAAQIIMEHCDGVFPNTPEEIRSLPGIGEYTVGAISSICFDRCTPAVDGNVLRVIARITEDYENIMNQSMKQRVNQQLIPVYPKERPGMFTQALMELGAMVCVPNGAPKCEECPVAGYCRAKKLKKTGKLPVKLVKKKVRKEQRTVLIAYFEGKIAIEKRADKGLLADLYQFPNEEGQRNEQEAMKLAEQMGFVPKRIERMLAYTHCFSHVEWDMNGYFFECREESKNKKWVSLEEVQQEYAIPSAFQPFLKMILEMHE